MTSLTEAKEMIRQTPVSSIIGFYYPVKMKGGSFEAVCPFHNDRHPSLKINDQKGVFKCFACGAGGDAISFVMDYSKLSFVDAVKDISDKLGIVLEEKRKFQKNPKEAMAQRVLKLAQNIYWATAQKARPKEYCDFLEKRGLKEEAVKQFEIGYAPAGSILYQYLLNKTEPNDREMAISIAKEIGIIRPDLKRENAYYDFFRSRVTFPILDQFGNLKGFSTRATREEQKPKYLNSGESFVFDKRNILFGLNFANHSIRTQDRVLIVEGHMDAISLHQSGFQYAVATMGVALSEKMIKVLSERTKHIYLGLDSDDAGFSAMTKINTEFLKLGILPMHVDYSPHKDPDEFLMAEGRLELQKRIDSAKTFVDAVIEKELPEKAPSNINSKIEYLERVFSILAPLEEHLFCKEKIQESAIKLGLRSSFDELLGSYRAYMAQSKKGGPPRARPQPRNLAQTVPPLEKRVERLVEEKIEKSLRSCIASILIHPGLLDHSTMPQILDLIDHSRVKQFFGELGQGYSEITEGDYTHLLKSKLNKGLPKDFESLIVEAVLAFDPHEQKNKNANFIEKVATEILMKLKSIQLKKQKQLLISRQNEIQDNHSGLELLKEIQDIESKIRELKTKPSN